MKFRHWLKVGLQAWGAASLVVAALAGVAYAWVPKSISASRIERQLVSPNGQYRAIHAMTSTGGVGYCYQFVILASAAQPLRTPSYSDSKDEAVFAAECQADVKAEWVDGSHLKVRLDLRADQDAHLVKMRAQDPGTHVLVKYEVNAQPSR